MIYEFEKKFPLGNTCDKQENADVNLKYESGTSRVVTETGSYKVAIIRDVFQRDNYTLHPEFQRRITWNSKKRSKLIESLIINIPIPPIFLYEYDYDHYEVMDGLQRLTAIIDFYENKYALTGLDEWSMLNGKKYKDLPDKIKDGIDRRQLQVITLLKETAATSERADKIKRLVFERLNTGGVRLQPQEIRNAIYNGKGNSLCILLSENLIFRKLWEIPDPKNCDFDDLDDEYGAPEDEKIKRKLERHSLYKRMKDVELVLRFFSMRHIQCYDYALSDFLDDTLIALNSYSDEQLKLLQDEFICSLKKADSLFGDKAFRLYNGEKWTTPTRTVYDPLMMALNEIDIDLSRTNTDNNIEMLKAFYNSKVFKQGEDFDFLFDGKHQSKQDILERKELFSNLLLKLK